MRTTARDASGLVATAVVAAVAGLACVGTGRLPWLFVTLSITSVIYLAVVFVGAAIVRAQPGNPVGWIFLVSGVCLPLATLIENAAYLQLAAWHRSAAEWAAVASQPLQVAAVPLIATFGILLFPGRPLAGRGRRVLAVLYAVDLLVLLVWGLFGTTSAAVPGLANPLAVPAADAGVLGILVLGPLSIGACVSLLRWARRADGPYASGLRGAAWVSFTVPAAYLACVATGISGGNTDQVSVVENCAALALAAAAWAGISRYGMFDRRAVLNRTLVYAVLSIVLAVVYLVSVALLDLVFTGAVPRVVAAVAAALAVLPLRDVAQRRINTLVYGLRDDPAAALARLGGQLDAAGTPDEILPAAARTVAATLRLRYVAIAVGGETLCEYGRLVPGDTEELPLPFAGETIGRLLVQTRSDGDLTAGERRLLGDLTRQVAVAARAVALTNALQLSRRRLVTLREDERRRLRRDLHDGLGPTLAGIALGIDTVRRADARDTTTAALLGQLRQETEAAVADIRRIVYDLRPPVLDELGLAGAVREHAIRFGAVGLDIEDLPALPAAVEVAAYRIAVEALANAARHAPGTPITVRLAVNGCLQLSIADAGRGIPDGFRAGVGLRSMRERAAELGGACTLRRREPSGTVVDVELPL
ncbi:MAG TPA: histidine kinase [Micromonosporaceae bacterium]